MTYDALNRLATRAVPANADAAAVTYTTGYDLVGRVLRLRQSTDAADVQYEYDRAGRMTREIRPDGRQIDYRRDADGNMTRLTWPTEAGNAFEAAYVYDALGRVTAIHEGADATAPRLALYGYDTASRRLSLERGNTTRTAWGWRPDGRVQTLTHSFGGGASIAFTYLYNREGGLSGRLLNDTTYQAEPAVQASTAYTANGLNQYSAIAAASLAYDANGNLTSDGTVTYRYDAQNRLVGFTAGATTIAYTYDPEGRRASRGTVRYLYAMGQEIAEYSQSGGTLAARYVPGAGQDEPLLAITATARAWYHTDAQGSVIARSGIGGVAPGAMQRFRYTPYGVTGAGSGTPPAFRWLGRRVEPSAPTADLYDMRARVYSASLGRFLQPDPIGTEGGLNLYAYVENDPLNAIDPSGEVAWAPIIYTGLLSGGSAGVTAYVRTGSVREAAIAAAVGFGTGAAASAVGLERVHADWK